MTDKLDAATIRETSAPTEQDRETARAITVDHPIGASRVQLVTRIAAALQAEREACAELAFKATKTIAERPYSPLQKAACVAATIRARALEAAQLPQGSE